MIAKYIGTKTHEQVHQKIMYIYSQYRKPDANSFTRMLDEIKAKVEAQNIRPICTSAVKKEKEAPQEDGQTGTWDKEEK